MIRFALFICIALLAGCMNRDAKEHVEQEHHEVEKTTTVREQPTVMPDGSIVTLTSTETVFRDLVDKGTADRELHEKTDFPLATAVVDAGVKVVAGASGLTTAQTVGGGLLTLVTAAMGAWAVTERKRGNEHKADADDAWGRLVPPKATPT